MKKFELHYHISNNGDGSASAGFHKTAKEAEKADNDHEGWGEPSVSSVKLKLENGKLYFEDYKDVEDEYQKVWIEILEEKI